PGGCLAGPPLWRDRARPCPFAQARAHDGRRRDRDERAGQGLGVHGAPAGRNDALILNLVGSTVGTFIWGSQARAEWFRLDARTRSVWHRIHRTPLRWPSRAHWPARMRTG